MTLSIKQPQRQADKLETANRLLSIGGTARRFNGRGYEIAKRAFDLLIIGFAAPILLPLMAVVALLIKLDSPDGPILETEKHVGRYGLRFSLYKFATGSDYSVTSIGNFLRMTGFDHLPQAFNVLIGDMTLVGPRPSKRGVEFYAGHQLARLDVAPGLTGLWQVAGETSMSFDESSYLDVAYVENRNLLLDTMILLYTIVAVVK